MKRCLLLVFSCIILASCSNKKNNPLFFKNDFENIKGWSEGSIVVKGNAHSGHFYIVADSTNPYSFRFKAKLKDIDTYPIKRLDINLWAMVSDFSTEARLVVAIMKENNSLFWEGKEFKAYISKTDQWTNIQTSIALPENINKDAEILIYIWNINGKGEARVDDLEIQFYK